MVVENLTALPHLSWRPKRVPGIGILCDDAQHAGSVGAEGERRSGRLHRPGPHRRLDQAIVLTMVGGNLTSQQTVDNFDGLAKPSNQLGRRGKVEAKDLVLGQVPARADADVQPTTA